MSQSAAPDVRWVAVGGAPLLSFLVALAGAMAARAALCYPGGYPPRPPAPGGTRPPRAPAPSGGLPASPRTLRPGGGWPRW